jgi:hypothetical protein
LNEDDLRHLDEILALDVDDPRRREALESPRLRSLLREYEDFMGTLPAVRDEPRTTRRVAPRGRVPRVARWLVLAASLAVIGLGIRSTLSSDPAPRFRSGESTHQIEFEIARRADGTVELSWAPIEEATALRLIVVGSDLAERGRIELPPASPARVDLRRFGLLEELALRIVAEGSEGELARSALQTIPAP